MGLELRTYSETLYYNDFLLGEAARVYYRTADGTKSNARNISILPTDDDGNAYYYSIDDPIEDAGEIDLIIQMQLDTGPMWYYTAYAKRAVVPWATKDETVFYPPTKIDVALYGYNDIVFRSRDRNSPDINNDGDLIYDNVGYNEPVATRIIAAPKSWVKYPDATVSSVEISNGHDLSSHLAPYRPPQANIVLLFQGLSAGQFPDLPIRTKVRIIQTEGIYAFVPFTGIVMEKGWSDEMTADGIPLYRLSLSCYGNSILIQNLPLETKLGTAQDITNEIAAKIKAEQGLILTNHLRGGFQSFPIVGNLNTDMFTLLTNFVARNSRYPTRFVETGFGEFHITNTDPDKRPPVQLEIQPGTGFSEQFRSTIQGIKYNAYKTEPNNSREVELFNFSVDTGGGPPGGRATPNANDIRTYNGRINTTHPEYRSDDINTWRPAHNWLADSFSRRWFWIGPVVNQDTGYSYEYSTEDGQNNEKAVIGDNFRLSVLTFTADSQRQLGALNNDYEVAPNLASISGTLTQKYRYLSGDVNERTRRIDGSPFIYEDGKVNVLIKINTYPYEVVQEIWPPGVDDDNVLDLQNNPGLHRSQVLTLARDILARERKGYREVKLTNLTMLEACQIDSYKQLLYNYYGQTTLGVILKYTLTYNAHAPFWQAKLSLIDVDKDPVRGAGKQIGLWDRRLELIGEFTSGPLNRLRTGFWSIVWNGEETVLNIGQTREHNNGRVITPDDFEEGDVITVDHFQSPLHRVTINTVEFGLGQDGDVTRFTWSGNSYNLGENEQLGGSGHLTVVNRTKVRSSIYLRDRGRRSSTMEIAKIDSLGNVIPDLIVGNVYHFYTHDDIDFKTIPDVSRPTAGDNAHLIAVNSVTTDNSGDVPMMIVNFNFELGGTSLTRNRALDGKIALYEVTQISSGTVSTRTFDPLDDTNCVLDDTFEGKGRLRVSEDGFLTIEDDAYLLISEE